MLGPVQISRHALNQFRERSGRTGNDDAIRAEISSIIGPCEFNEKKYVRHSGVILVVNGHTVITCLAYWMRFKKSKFHKCKCDLCRAHGQGEDSKE